VRRDDDPADELLVRDLVREHAARTGSPRARALLDRWDRVGPLLRKLVPHTAPAAAAAPATSPAAAAPAAV